MSHQQSALTAERVRAPVGKEDLGSAAIASTTGAECGKRFSSVQREKVRPIIILLEMDICSDPSKLDRTRNHVHPIRRTCLFFSEVIVKELSCSASQFL